MLPLAWLLVGTTKNCIAEKGCNMIMEIDFSVVNDYLISKGLDRFPFDSIKVNVADEQDAKNTASRYYNHLMDWVQRQENRDKE